MNESKNILDFYYGLNYNKHDIALGRPGRYYSTAEYTVLSCLDALFRHDAYASKNEDWDVLKTIKMILYPSFHGKYENLKGKDEINETLIELYDGESKESFYAEHSLNTVANNEYWCDVTIPRIMSLFSRLQTTIREGHKLWGAKGKRLESDLEHTYGTLLLVTAHKSEYNYQIDYDKILIMLLVHETEEILMGDKTVFDGYTPEEIKLMGKKAVKEVFKRFPNGQYYISLLDEFNDRITIESQYAHLFDKLEYILQVKQYQLEGRYDFKHRPQNRATTSYRVLQIIDEGADNVFDVHYEFDKYRFHDCPSLRLLLDEAKKM